MIFFTCVRTYIDEAGVNTQKVTEVNDNTQTLNIEKGICTTIKLEPAGHRPMQ